MNTACRRRFRCLWLVPLLLALAPAAPAVDIGSLYDVSVPLQGSGGAAQQRAFSDAMAAVLVRVTGRRDAPQLPALAGLVQQPSRYVRTFRRAPGGLLAVTFDGDAIESAVAIAGLPFWGADRPLTLVWLVVDRDGGPQLVTAASAGAERRAVELVASQRGLPLAWPVGDALDNPRLRVGQVLAGDAAALAETAGRYGADAVLVGRPAPAGIAWTLSGPGGSREVAGALEDGPHLAADRHAASLAVAGGASRNEVLVEVTGIETASAYAEASRLLAALEPVRAVGVRELRQDAVLFQLTVRGDEAGLRRALAAAGRFVPAGSSPAGPVFRFLP